MRYLGSRLSVVGSCSVTLQSPLQEPQREPAAPVPMTLMMSAALLAPVSQTGLQVLSEEELAEVSMSVTQSTRCAIAACFFPVLNRADNYFEG